MGFSNSADTRPIWVHAARGTMTFKIDGPDGRPVLHESDQFTGFISEVKTAPKKFEGAVVGTELHLVMIDIDEKQPRPVIISGTLKVNGAYTTYARMLLARLVNPDNKIDAAEAITISLYNNSEKNSCCVKLSRAGQREPLPGISFKNMNETEMQEFIARALEVLQNKYSQDILRTAANEED